MADQRSLENIEQVQILPATDLIFDKERLEKAALALDEAVKKASTNLAKETKEQLDKNFSAKIDTFLKGELSAKDLSLVEYIYPEKLSLFDYLAPNAEVFFDDYRVCAKKKNN